MLFILPITIKATELLGEGMLARGAHVLSCAARRPLASSSLLDSLLRLEQTPSTSTLLGSPVVACFCVDSGSMHPCVYIYKHIDTLVMKGDYFYNEVQVYMLYGHMEP